MTIKEGNELLEFLNECDSSVGIYPIEKLDKDTITAIEQDFNLSIIDYKENYFIFEDGSQGYVVYHKPNLFNKWQETIFTHEEYERLQYKNKEESEIYHNGLDVCRINFYMNTDTFKNVLKFMRDNNMYTFDDSKTISFQVREGNNCIPYVPTKFIPVIENALNLELSTDFHRHFIGKNDIIYLKEKQKIELEYWNMFTNDTVIKGTVIHTDDKCVHVRPYRSKTKYYIIEIGSECSIKTIEKF